MTQGHFISGANGAALPGDADEEALREARSAERVRRLYDAKSGPLMAWLREERIARGETPAVLCARLGVRAQYLSALCAEPESQQAISVEFAARCARYLSVPPIVVRVLTDQITIRDFVQPPQSEEEVVDRSLRRIAADPIARQLLPADLAALPLAAKRAFVLMYAEFLGTDFFGLRSLPGVLQELEPAVQVHFTNATAAKLRAIAARPPRDGTGGQLTED